MPLSRFVNMVDRKLGRCPRCMRMAFFSMIVSWLAFLALGLITREAWLTTSMLLAAIGISALWLAHVGTYGWRVWRALHAEYLSHRRPLCGADIIDRQRRLWVLGTAASLTICAAVWLPATAFAIGHECGTGKHCPDSAPNCCSRSSGKCCNTGWACTATGKCYASHADARAACGSTGIVWACS